MIASLRGTVAVLGPDQAVLEVGGVGLAVSCTPTTLAALRVGQPAFLATTLVVREDSLTLYGFADPEERDVFEVLQTASGVGPRLAQAAVATLTPDTLRRAVASEDLTTLCRVPGIGRKGAQRIVLELKDRIGVAPSADPAVGGWEADLRSGLTGLGYSAREVEEALAAVLPPPGSPSPAAPDVPGLLKAALAVLRRG